MLRRKDVKFKKWERQAVTPEEEELLWSKGLLVDLHLRTYADLYSFMQCLSSKSKI